MRKLRFLLLFFLKIYKAVATFRDKVCTSFFYIFIFFLSDIQLEGQTCFLDDEAVFSHNFQQLHCKGQRLYPVTCQDNKVRILVVPHGYDEQAQYLMAATYQILHNQIFDTVFLLCQADVNSFHGVALPLHVNDSVYFKKLSVDIDCLARLSEHSLFSYYQVPFCYNLAIPLQCNFLKMYNPDVKIIPLVVGTISQQDACQIAKMIVSCCNKQTLIVMSADIGYYENVVQDCLFDVSKVCKVYDQDICLIQIMQSIALYKQNLCYDRFLASSVLYVLFELLHLPILQNVASYFVGYTTSCCDSIMMESITSYGAFIFQDHGFDYYKNYIGSYEQSQLLQQSRVALHNLFQLQAQRLPQMISYEMSQPHGLFVSLYGMSDHGIMLKGCMGKVKTHVSLQQMVRYMTEQAACHDIRFYPLREKEIFGTVISLSLITDVHKVDNFESIQECDGIMLKYKNQDAVKLPGKIAILPWTYERALNKLSYEIESNSCIWKKPRAQVFTFRTDVFQEE